MAKNLKLKVKNTQLAEALKKSKLKKEGKAAAIVEKPTKSLKLNKVAKHIPPKSPPKKPAHARVEAEEKRAEPTLEEKPTEKKKEQKFAPVLPSAEKTLLSKEKESPPQKEQEEEKKTSFKEIKKRDYESPESKEKTQEGYRAEFSRVTRDLKANRFDSRDRHGLRVGEERAYRKRRPRFRLANKPPVDVIRPKTLSVRLPISVKDLAQAMKRKSSELISTLFAQGTALTLNDDLNDETEVQLLGQEFDCEITIDTSEEKRLRITDKSIQEEISSTELSKLEMRPPIVTFMGHVDHGKTSLIDTIRKSNVASSEAGAITQHIGAFRCHREQGDITILDTPGHEAFSMMRMRGATITDIVVLVIAGDEGIMPQTDEAIAQAKKNQIPIVVVINKCDKEGFDAENVHRQLAERELVPEAWGGSVITVNCSASTAEGIPELLEMLILQSEILELKADYSARARGTLIESQLHKGFGAIGTILVQNGTLKLGDALVIDEVYARIKTMHDEHGKNLRTAGPATPVKITGLSGVPTAGNEFIVVESERQARKLAAERKQGTRRLAPKRSPEKIESLIERHRQDAQKKVLNLIICADVQGSVEALKTSLLNIKSKKVDLNFISERVGEISESDIELAIASNAVVIGFHTQVEGHAENLIKREKVIVKKHNVIYQILDDVKQLMLASLDKIRKETESGTAEVKKVFKSSHLGSIAGCQVTDGLIKRNQHAKVIRQKQVVGEGSITSLKREKEYAKEATKGLECGILIDKFTAFEVDDIIKTFDVTYVQQEL